MDRTLRCRLPGAESGTGLPRDLLACAIKSDRIHVRGLYHGKKQKKQLVSSTGLCIELQKGILIHGDIQVSYIQYIEPLIVVSSWPRHPSKWKLRAGQVLQSDD